jgi:hypothetical protein
MFFDRKLYPFIKRLVSINSTLTQLWNPEDGVDIFSETSVRTRSTGYKVPGDIYNRYDGESTPEDFVVQPYIVSLYGEADEQ